jgi:hypothetical protein
MHIIAQQTEYEEQEWNTRDLKEAKQMLKDAIQYQQYWTERGTERRLLNFKSLPTKFNVWCGIYTRASIDIGIQQARQLLEGYWKSGLDDAGRYVDSVGYDTAENEFTIEINEYRISFQVKVETTGQHINQAKFDKIDEFRESLFNEEEE